MLVACWSVKGGSGTTVVAAGLALVLARSVPAEPPVPGPTAAPVPLAHDSRGAPGVLLVDLAGDLPAVLGLPEPERPGVAEWLASDADVPDDAFGLLEVDAAPGLRLVPRGSGELPPRRASAW